MDDRELIERARVHAMGLKEHGRFEGQLRSDLTCADAVSYGGFIDELADRLSTLSTDREAIRREAFEEAVKVAKAVFDANPGNSEFASGSRAAAAGIEAAIRALGDRK